MYGRFNRSSNHDGDKEEERFTIRQWCGRINARRVGFFLCILGYTWALALFGFTLNRDEMETVEVERYNKGRSVSVVNTILEKMSHAVEDINKTNHDLLERVKHLENEMEINQHNFEISKKFQSKLENQEAAFTRLLNNSNIKTSPTPHSVKITSSECEPSSKERKEYTDCKDKMKYLENNWSHNDCYKELGVDGSRCSIRRYLSEVEPFCPLMKDREKKYFQSDVTKPADDDRPWTNTNPSYSDLIGILTKQSDKKKTDWMRKRIENIWDGWSEATKNLNLPRRRRKKVLLYLGLLTNMPGAKFSEAIRKGGPLGELVQWSDIITSLYLLGHDVTVISDVTDVLNYLSQTQFLHIPCKDSQGDKHYVDLIYTDIFAFKHLEERIEQTVFNANRCVFRLVDSFGTEPIFNWKSYAVRQGVDRYWGSCNLNPKQFCTLFPHSPDNSFMGFVVKKSTNQMDTKRKNQALVYGKRTEYWSQKTDYINMVHSSGLEIHGTVHTGKSVRTHPKVPQYVHNHGLLTTAEVRKILRESKIFVGMGFPYEGPAPLEALAEGCTFLNVKLDPPHNGLNTKFFQPKPTRRKLTSQVPYLEKLGPPYVFTVNINDPQNVKTAVNEAIQAVDTGKVKPFIPREFTEAGMLERLNAYIERQDFCSPAPALWPPLSEGQVHVGKPGASCIETCAQKDLLCEPAHFPFINNEEALKKYFQGNCSSAGSSINHLYPAKVLNSKTCNLQEEKMLFSCAGEDANLQRLCPCVAYHKQQSALCRNCL